MSLTPGELNEVKVLYEIADNLLGNVLSTTRDDIDLGVYSRDIVGWILYRRTDLNHKRWPPRAQAPLKPSWPPKP